jgi:hypothetical protein
MDRSIWLPSSSQKRGAVHCNAREFARLAVEARQDQQMTPAAHAIHAQREDRIAQRFDCHGAAMDRRVDQLDQVEAEYGVGLDRCSEFSDADIGLCDACHQRDHGGSCGCHALPVQELRTREEEALEVAEPPDRRSG